MFKSLKEVQEEFKEKPKEEIVEMFYNMAIKLNLIEERLKDIEEILNMEEE